MADVILRPPSLSNAVPQNVDEYFREIQQAILQLASQLNSLISQIKSIDARVTKLGG